MELQPILPEGRQIIERYGAAGFRVSGIFYKGSILVFADRTQSWPVEAAAGVSLESLAPVFAHGGVEMLVVGLGRKGGILGQALRLGLKEAGIAFEPMETGAACRTYNILLGEDRPVAAALLPFA